jgi:outer membrane PBP1 activator LpoA protein
MMRKAITLVLLAVMLAACGTNQPGKPAPTVLGTQAPAQATEAPMLPHY